jgi:transcriptional regulator with XRE-family HTH domain
MARQRMSQADVAARIGMTPGALNLRMTGKQDFKIGELLAVADQLGVPVAQFMPAAVATR